MSLIKLYLSLIRFNSQAKVSIVFGIVFGCVRHVFGIVFGKPVFGKPCSATTNQLFVLLESCCQLPPPPVIRKSQPPLRPWGLFLISGALWDPLGSGRGDLSFSLSLYIYMTPALDPKQGYIQSCVANYVCI